ncbi:hypothetical protein PENSTE_c007G01022 [Penicillium steckii]|uniref:Cytochrome P450 n=1 Tax=Penicillium steckii TaxID=303698 RepID=A0A1V6TEZ2_9EURO|nr:hypothetical protein PENSTE_c007G01022 [Penicillium steckii]
MLNLGSIPLARYEHQTPLPILILQTTVILGLGYISLSTIFNLVFHPLANVPGPFWARCSNLWGRYQNLHGQKAHSIHAAHKRYGSVVRIAPNTLSFSSPSSVREIYMSKTFVKEETFYTAKRIFHENHLLSFRDKAAHHQRRKLLSRGFSQAALAEFEPVIHSKIHTLLQQLSKISSTVSVFDVYPWVHMLSFDIIYNMMFGIDPETLTSGKEHTVMPWFRSWRLTYIFKELFPSLETYGSYVPGKIGGYFRDVQKWKMFAVEIVQSCRDEETKTPFLSKVLNGQDGFLGRLLTDSELAEECMGGMFGGSGTTGTTFIYLLWAVLQRPSVVKKLRDELDTAFPPGCSSPDSVACSKLSYLQAVLNESLRLYPATIAVLPRTAVTDTTVGGVHIPRGTNVATQNLTIHRDPQVFEDPDSFLPERWLNINDTGLKEALTPFSVGPRKCIGSNLAEMELRLLIALFFLRFDATIDSSMKEEDMFMYDTFNMSPAGKKLLVSLKERK